MPLHKDSMKYCGVQTPFSGTKIYIRALMDLSGSSEYLGELLFRVIGDLMEDGVATRIADDLFVDVVRPRNFCAIGARFWSVSTVTISVWKLQEPW